jgi:hypothetical protein
MALIGLEALLMDPCLTTAFGPIATAINGICKICHVDVTVLDGMHFLGVHYKVINLVAVWKHRFEQIQQPRIIS